MGVVAPTAPWATSAAPATFSSEVMLLVTRAAPWAAIVQRTGEPVLVEGLGYPGTRLRLRPLTAEADIVEGDVIVTSGMSCLFPKGVPIGVVEEVAVGPFGLSVDVRCARTSISARWKFVAVLGAPRGRPGPRPARAGRRGR